MDDSELSGIFKEASGEICSNSGFEISARFYKYSGIKSTIHRKHNLICAKVSDVLSDAPREVIKSLAVILISKIERKPIHKSIKSIYRSWINSKYVSGRSAALRKERLNTIKINPFGDAYNLTECFENINSSYFEGVLERPHLTWSSEKTYRKFGHYDPARHLISISRTLDSIKVPQFVLEYVLYHEMLHIIHDSKISGTKMFSHHKAFREDEMKFHKFNEARLWMSKLRFFR